MKTLLNSVQKNLFLWVVASTTAGIFYLLLTGGHKFSPIICIFAALFMIYPSLVPLSFNKLSGAFSNKKIIIASLILNFVVSPLLALTIGNLILPNYPSLQLGLLIISLLPGGGLVTVWAIKSKADLITTIGIVFTNLLAAIVITPFILSWFLTNLSRHALASSNDGKCVASTISNGKFSCAFGNGISPLTIAIPLLVIVIFPLLIAFLTQKLLIKIKGEEYFNQIKSLFSSFSNLGLVLILFILLGIENNKIIFEQKDILIKGLIPLLIYYLVNLGIIIGIYKIFLYKKPQGTAFVWGSFLRYITLALGISISLGYQNPALISSVIIIVISYFIQIPLSALLSRYFEKQNTLFFAVVGVSNNPEKYGYKVFADLIKSNKEVWGINPKEGVVLGKKVYPNLESLPQRPTTVIFVTPPEVSESILSSVIKLKIPNVWFQPGSNNENTIRICKENNINATYNACIMKNQP